MAVSRVITVGKYVSGKIQRASLKGFGGEMLSHGCDNVNGVTPNPN